MSRIGYGGYRVGETYKNAIDSIKPEESYPMLQKIMTQAPAAVRTQWNGFVQKYYVYGNAKRAKHFHIIGQSLVVKAMASNPYWSKQPLHLQEAHAAQLIRSTLLQRADGSYGFPGA
jgi:hypothetical protein